MIKRRLFSFLKVLLIALILFFFSFATFYTRGNAEMGKCQKVDVYVHDSLEVTFINRKEVLALVRESGFNPIGKEVSTINTEALEKALKKNPRIKRAECFKTTDGNIKVEIYQRVPVMRVMSMNGNYYIDSEAETMPVSTNYSVFVPLASGFISEDFAKNELFKLALFLQENEFWNAQISQIYVHPNNDISFIPRVGDQVILIGSLDNLEGKLSSLMSLYNNGFSELGWNRYKKINLKYEHQIICTKKE